MRDALEKNLFTELPRSRAIGKLHGQTLKGMKHFEQGTTQAFFLHDPDRQYAVVAFRGTQVEVTRDILADLDVRATDLGNGVQVHNGFHHALHEVTDTSRMKSTAELLLERLDFLPQGTELYLTGHSLGGALATLFASEVLARSGRPYVLRGLYTFGAPASGNDNFAKLLNDGLRREKAWHGRFTYGGDLVPGSTSWTAGYVHNTNYDQDEPRHAQAITLGCEGKGYELTESRRSLPCEGWVGIDDHDKLDYFSALKAIVDRAKTDADLRIRK